MIAISQVTHPIWVPASTEWSNPLRYRIATERQGQQLAGGANGEQTGLNNSGLCGDRQGNLPQHRFGALLAKTGPRDEPQSPKHENESPAIAGLSHGADDGTRTHDTWLGKPVLYQLSYVRAPRILAVLRPSTLRG